MQVSIQRDVPAPFWSGGTAPYGVAVGGSVGWLRGSLREAVATARAIRRKHSGEFLECHEGWRTDSGLPIVFGSCLIDD